MTHETLMLVLVAATALGVFSIAGSLISSRR